MISKVEFPVFSIQNKGNHVYYSGICEKEVFYDGTTGTVFITNEKAA